MVGQRREGRDMRRILGIVLVASGLVIATGSAAARASSPSELSLPGPAFFPESITAAPNGALFVSSLVTGEIVRFAPGLSKPKTFVADDVNVGTAGVMVDPERNVLWACAVDLSSPLIRAARVRPADGGAGGELHHARRRTVCGHRARARRRVRDRHSRRSHRPSHRNQAWERRGGNACRVVGRSTACCCRTAGLPPDQRHRVRRRPDLLHHQLQHRRAVRRPDRARRLGRAADRSTSTRR